MKGPGVYGASPSPAWVPDEATLKRSRLLRAMKRWGQSDLEALHARSVEDPEWYWRAVVEDIDLHFDVPFHQVLDDSEGKPFPRWFVGGRFNLANACVSRHASGDLADKTAVVFEADNGSRAALTYAELDRDVSRFAANLLDLGVTRGDRVLLFAPMLPEMVVAFFACAYVGAVAVPAFTGYGAEAVASRIRGSGAVLMLTADATTRRGKRIDLKAVADEALTEAPSVRHVVVVQHLDGEVPMVEGRDVFWHDLRELPVPEVADTDPNEPVVLAYTSGTTGAPKGIVHSHAGLAVKTGVDFAYGFDVHQDDVLAWIVDIGWMLAPVIMAGGLQLGATIVLTEGVPTYPTRTRLWEIVERNGVTLQGIAPTAARAIFSDSEGQVIQDISSLRAFASTGEAWDEPTWRWLFETIGASRRPIINYSGGTEVPGALVISYPFLPADAAAFNGPAPGIDVAVLDSEGNQVLDQIGELAVFNTWPGITHAFWQDRERYLETYWSTWPDTWVHGDLASVTADGSWVLHGRSDDTMKVSGRRIGPAELEAALLKDRRIAEVAVIGVPDEMRGQRVVAFVVVPDPAVDHDDLVATAERNVGRSFAPTVHVVAALPKTTNGKIMRRTIRARHLGEPLGDLTSLDSRLSLEAIPPATTEDTETTA